MMICLAGLVVFETPLTLVGNASGTTLYVNTTGSGGAYTSIQDAIDNATNGDTVYVYSGIYYEALTINTEINLTGEDRESTIIDANGSADVIHVKKNYVNIQGFTVLDARTGTIFGGIYLNNANYCTIQNNIISDTWKGIYLYWSSHTIISNNTINQSKFNCIFLDRSGYVTLKDNIMMENGIGFESGMEQHWNTHNIDTTNTVNGKPVYYWKNQTGGNVPQDAGQVILAKCNNVWVEDHEFTNCSQVIRIGFSSNIFVIGNNVSNGYHGIRITRSDHIHIVSNNVTNCDYGIATDSSDYGLYQTNRLLNNKMGLVFSSSESNTIRANSIKSNDDHGVLFSTGSHNNVAYDNYFEGNKRGMTLNGIMYLNASENTMIGDGFSITGMTVDRWNTHIIDTSNTVNGKPVYYWKNQTGGIVPQGAGQVILANCTNVIVERQELHNQTIGIMLGNSSGNHIRENNISLSYYGLYLQGSHFNNIDNNNVSNSDRGYYSYRSNYNNLTRNSIIDSNYYSLYLTWSNNNTFHHNNFIESYSVDNYIPFDSYDNIWDDGQGEGNYWSDYKGFDDGSNGRVAGDGVGDTNLRHHRDNYPLMEPYPDSNPPLIQLISPSNDSIVLPGTVLDFLVMDYHLDNVNLSLDDGPMVPFLPPFNISTDTWPDGLYKITIYADDTFNNSVNESYFFTIDSTRPKILLNSPSNNSIIHDGTELNFSVIDANLLHANYSVNGGPELDLAEPFNISTAGWSDYNYVISISALDKAGLSNSSSYEFTVDSTPPIITLNDSKNYAIIPSGKILNFTIVDANLKEANFSINDGISESLSDPFDISTSGWEEKEYSILINASDLAGNRHSSEFEFTVDSTPPAIFINSSINHSTIYYDEKIPINITDLHLEDAFFSFNDGPDVRFNSPYTLAPFFWGGDYHNITIKAIDAAGNMAVIWFDIYLDWNTDFNPPEVVSTTPSNGSNDVLINTTVVITFSEPMSQINTEFYISCSPYVEFDLEWDETSTILYFSFEQSNLMKATIYTLKIDSQIGDLTGNSMESDFTMSFITETPLELDSDNDGYKDDIDEFPLDPSEWLDTDKDGIGNNADPDDDNDGVPDERDDFPLDPGRWEKETKQDLTLYVLILVIVVIITVILVMLVLKQKKGKSEPIKEEPPEVEHNELPPPPPPPQPKEMRRSPVEGWGYT